MGDVEPVLAKTREILQRVRNHQCNQETALSEINTALRHFSQISWWGTASDLLSGNAPFPRDVRRWFREQRGGSNVSDQPINTEEEKSFLNSLEEYGL